MCCISISFPSTVSGTTCNYLLFYPQSLNEGTSFRWRAAREQRAMGRKWNTGNSKQTQGKTSFLWGCAPCPERLWSLLPCRHSKAIWKQFWMMRSRGPCLSRRENLLRFPATSAILRLHRFIGDKAQVVCVASLPRHKHLQVCLEELIWFSFWLLPASTQHCPLLKTSQCASANLPTTIKVKICTR